jgi:prenylcysteine oxidase/farnesylcysteine lyase
MWRCVVALAFVGTVLAADVAIIGGGIAGAASAYFIQQIRPHDTVTLFEKTHSLGGRLHEDTIGGITVETGGTAIHSSNQYMQSFIQLANLTTNGPQTTNDSAQLCSSGGGVGIWDGQAFRFHTTGTDSSFDTMVKLGLMYGLSPLIVKNAVQDTLNSWQNIYDLLESNDAPGFLSLDSMFTSLKLNELLHQDSHSYLKSKWIGDQFISEFVDGVSRVNYGQDSSINAFADLVSLAGAGISGDTYSVDQGNSKVVEFLARNASIRFGAEVTSVEILKRCSTGQKKMVHYTSHGKHIRSKSFDAVILAAPYDPSRLKLIDETGVLIKPWPVSYKKTFVTFLEGSLNPSAFGLSDCTTVPDSITTTQGTSSFFRSVALHGTSTLNPGLGVYKVFSDAETTDDQLKSVFAEIGMVKRYAYDAYPVLTPLSGNPSETLFEVGGGIFYANVMERTASCMEVEAIAARNVALLVNEYLN